MVIILQVPAFETAVLPLETHSASHIFVYDTLNSQVTSRWDALQNNYYQTITACQESQVIQDIENIQYKTLFFHSPVVQGERNFSVEPTRAPEITAS